MSDLENQEKIKWYQSGKKQLALLTLFFLCFFVGGVLFVWVSARFFDNYEETYSQEYRITTYADPSIGPENAKIQIFQFADYGCPYCRDSVEALKILLAVYPEDVRWVYKDFPFTELHPDSLLAHQASQCAHEQDHFMEMHDLLYSQIENHSKDILIGYARKIGLDEARFKDCLETRKYKNEVESDLREGIALGVSATPTWFINGYKIEGVIPPEVFLEIVNMGLSLQ